MTSLDPKRIFATLDKHEVEYLTIGAWAVIAHGYVRATADIDFVARQDKKNFERLSRAFKELGATLRGIDADKLDINPTDAQTLGNGASFTPDTLASPIDYLNDVPGAANFDSMRKRARRVEAGGVGVWVVGYEDLISMKLASGRDQDLLGVRELQAIHESHNDSEN